MIDTIRDWITAAQVRAFIRVEQRKDAWSIIAQSALGADLISSHRTEAAALNAWAVIRQNLETMTPPVHRLELYSRGHLRRQIVRGPVGAHVTHDLTATHPQGA